MPFRDGLYVDGGFSNLTPLPSGCERGVRVCCLPTATVFPADIGPDVGGAAGADGAAEYSLLQTLRMALLPPTTEEVAALREMGRAHARRWLDAESLAGGRGEA